MCQNRRCAATPEAKWVELVIQKADGSIARERHSETAGVLMTNILGSEAAMRETGKRVWWADEYDAAHPAWTAVGHRGNFQVMTCSLHGEFLYQLGMAYQRAGGTSCGGCHAEGIVPRDLAVEEDAPF